MTIVYQIPYITNSESELNSMDDDDASYYALFGHDKKTYLKS